jgi:hypothetical protein
MAEKKKKKDQSETFIQVVRGDTKSEAAKRSMNEIMEKLKSMEKHMKKGKQLFEGDEEARE